MVKRYEEELVTKNLKVIDDEERVRVVIGSTDDGQSGLAVLDEAQRARASIRVGRGGAFMNLWSRNEHPSIAVAVEDTAGASLLLLDKHGKPRVSVAAGDGGPVVLYLNGEEGEPRLVAFVEDDLPGIVLFDGEGEHSGVHILTDHEEGNSLKIVGRENGGFTKLSVPFGGEPGLVLYDEDEGTTHTV
jgi:hypothetical protein